MIQRYEPTWNGDQYDPHGNCSQNEPEEDSNGDYVLYEDHLAIVEELTKRLVTTREREIKLLREKLDRVCDN
jgi:hypothetical protein